MLKRDLLPDNIRKKVLFLNVGNSQDCSVSLKDAPLRPACELLLFLIKNEKPTRIAN